MENSIYQGKMICTYDLKDENGVYYEEQVLDWKEAAGERRLRCVDCGAPVYLAAGPIKEPYFAHYDIEECDYSSGQESEELKKGKRLLYQLLKRSLPDCNIQARYRLENGMYSTLFCSDGEQFISIDYRLVNNSLEKFRLRDNYYQNNRIRAIYILGKRQEKNTKQLDWYQNLIQNSMGYLAFLDTKKELLTLKKSFGYRLGKERHFKYCSKAYPVKDLTLEFTGRMECDFTSLCKELEQQIEEEKIRYQRTQDRLRQLQEEKLRLEQEEQLRLENYRMLQKEKIALEKSRIHEETSVQTPDLQLALPTKEFTDAPVIRTEAEILALGLNPVLYSKCLAMIEQGEGHLVAKKYYDYIMKT
jgi:competence CoiA-like predicted nuclease